MAAATENKLKYGLCNVHYAPLTSDANGTAVFETPVPMPGAVSTNLEPKGEFTVFYADNRAYYVSATNGGYEGEIEIARVPDSFRTDILKEEKDEVSGTMVENISAEPVPFALLFEFAGDVRAVKYVLYNCSVSRPNIEGQTIGETKEPKPEKLKIKCGALSNGNVKANTLSSADGTASEGWYTSVWQPDPKV